MYTTYTILCKMIGNFLLPFVLLFIRFFIKLIFRLDEFIKKNQLVFSNMSATTSNIDTGKFMSIFYKHIFHNNR